MNRFPAFALLLLLVLFQACSGKTEEQELAEEKLAQLNWLVGNWKGRVESDNIYEQWSKKTDNTLQGHGYIISGKSLGQESQELDTLFSERMEIVARNGEITLAVRMAGQAETVFTATELTPGRAVFENPEHDFPNRIIYAQPTDGSLTATIEGKLNGKAARESFTMRKARQLP